MEIVNSLCMPAPRGSGIQYTFCGYISENVRIVPEMEYMHLRIPSSVSAYYGIDDENNAPKYEDDRILIRRITPNVLRLRNHLWVMDVNSYEEGTRVKKNMLECGVLKEDIQFNYSGVPLEALNQKIEDSLHDGESPEKLVQDIERNYPALMYVIRCSMRY